MFEIVLETISTLMDEAATYPDEVRAWMRLIAFSLFISVIFVTAKSGARWVLAIAVMTAMGMIIGKMAFPDLARATIGTTLHLVLWPFVLVALWRPSERRAVAVSKIDTAYRFWRYWVSALITVSLFLDGRTMLGLAGLLAPGT